MRYRLGEIRLAKKTEFEPPRINPADKKVEPQAKKVEHSPSTPKLQGAMTPQLTAPEQPVLAPSPEVAHVPVPSDPEPKS